MAQTQPPPHTPDDRMATDFVTKVKQKCTPEAYQIFLQTLEKSKHKDTGHPGTRALLLVSDLYGTIIDA